MTKAQKQRYEDSEALRRVLVRLRGRKFRLNCGHHVTFGHYLGNDVMIVNGRKLKIICFECGR